jgi:hypothetical protein
MAPPHAQFDALPAPENAGDRTDGLCSSSVEHIWKTALDSLGDMTAEFARHAGQLIVAGPQRLVAQFGAGYILHKESCERPDRRAKLEEAVSRAAGHCVRLELELVPGEAAKPVRPQPPPSARQRQREKEQHPLVRRAMELFDAEIVGVDELRESTR